MNDHQQHEAVLKRGLERIRAKTPEQRKAFLKQIGILDQDGQLAERYSSKVETAVAQAQDGVR